MSEPLGVSSLRGGGRLWFYFQAIKAGCGEEEVRSLWTGGFNEENGPFPVSVPPRSLAESGFAFR